MNSTSLILVSLFASTLLSAGSISSEPREPSLVVYNSHIGLVHEKRQLRLDKGPQALIYEEIASSLIPDSVHVTLPKGVTLYSQQYRFDQINAQKLALAHLGQNVKFYLQTGSDLMYKSGTLLSASSQAVVRTAQNEIFTVPISALVFSDIPKELITKPSLVWNVDAPKKSDTSLSLDYLINNISWSSNYVLNLNKDDADLVGWITIDNRSGKAFNATKLALLAGDINRAVTPLNRRHMAQTLVAEMDSGAVAEIAHEGYHLYQVPFTVDLANNENTQIKFLEITAIPIQREYKAVLNSPFYSNGEQRYPVTQSLSIKSLEKALPMGTVRTYSQEAGTMLLLGESSINHTPKHEQLDITLGKNFDLLTKSTIIANSSDRYYNDVKVAYELTNRTDTSKTVELLIPFQKQENGQSSVTTSKKYHWKNGDVLAFEVTLKADSKERFEVHFRAKK